MTQLVGFAVLPAETFAAGPPAGEGIDANGFTGPFPGQPVQGFSGVQFAPGVVGSPATFLFLSDNGFGSQTNSTDYLLRLYEAVPNFRTASGGDGTIDLEVDADGFVTSFIQLADPNNLIPFEIINEGTEERLLTGGDFDIESFVIAENGDLFVGEEFGPFILHFNGEGELVEAPIPTPNITNLDTLNGQDPIVIGHRGASGERPEHTLEAYELAIEQGADFIEPDLVTTSDGVLIARHEPLLAVVQLDEEGNIVFDADGNPTITEETTDVADLEQFADRLTVKLLDGVPFGGWFAEDFTLAEIQELSARERIPGTRPLNTAFNDEFVVPTFVEVIELLQQVEAETGLEIGIYPETKHPTYFDRAETFQNEDANGNGVLDDGEDINQNGQLDVVNGGGAIDINLNELLVEDLLATGFTDPDRIFIQSFELENLIELDQELLPAAGLEDLPLVQLFGDITDSFVQPNSNFSRPFDITFNAGEGGLTPAELEEIYGDLVDLVDGGITAETGYGALANAEVLDFISTYADGLGPWQNSILLREPLETPVDADGDGRAQITNQLTGEIFPLIDLAHDAELLVHVYTLRDEENFLSLLADGSLPTPEDQYEQFIELGADGFFTDFPETGDRVRDAVVAPEVRSPQNPDVQFASLNGQTPIVIGHRGASGERPEHTLEAYERAIAQGADFIEPDLAITSDGVLIARHEPILDDTTNIAEVFGPERQATKILDGEVITAYFAEDFTLEEIKQLRAIERIPGIRPGNAEFDGQFEIPTLQEVIELVQQVEAETGRQIGIYPETKHPTFFDAQDLSLEEPLVQTLLATGFTDPDRIFIQSFEIENLLDLEGQLAAAGLGDIPLVQLFGDTEGDFINQGGGGFSVPFDVVANFGDRAVESLEFLGIDLIPGDLTVDGTEVGGLSGLGLQPGTTDTYFAVSDDYQGADARFYNFNIDLSDGTLDAGDITFDSETSDPVFFLDNDGTTFTSDEVATVNRGTDTEGLAFLPNGNLLLSSEGLGTNADPFIREYALDGTLVAELPVDAKNLSTIDPGNAGVRGSAGFESLTITPDNQFLFAGNERTLIQDGPDVDFGQEGLSRITQYDLTTNEPIAEFVYEVTANTLIPQNPDGTPNLDGGRGRGLVELLALDENRLFALEREFAAGVTDGDGSRPVRLYEIDLSEATNVIDEDSLEGADFEAVGKRLVFDFEELLGQGLIPDERIGSFEGLAFGPELPDGRQVLLVLEDNDFSTAEGDRDTQVIAFAINPFEFDPAEAEAIYGDLADFIDFEDPTYGDLANPEALEVIATDYASGLGPWQNNILLRESLETPVEGIPSQLTGEVFPLIDFAHDAGLLVHPYTLRDEPTFLSLLPDGTVPTPEEQYRQFIELGADGFFTDFPETGRIVVDQEIVESNLPQSRGYEGLAFSPDRTTAFPLLEGAVAGDPEGALRIYEFDLETQEFAEDLVGFYQLEDPDHAIGDFTPINADEYLVIERDGLQGAEAAFKQIFKVNLSEVDEDGFVAKELVADLLDIADPDDLNGDGETTFAFPFVTIEDVLVLDENTILVANDNNFPFSIGRDFDGIEIDNNEVIQLQLDEPLNLDPNIPFLQEPVEEPDARVIGSGDADLFLGGLDIDAVGNTILAGAGDDEIILSSAGAVAGNNLVLAGSGNDTIFVSVNDTVFGGPGADTLIAAAAEGSNSVSGGEGDDTFIVEGSGDRFLGDAGDDLFIATGGGNSLAGGEGADTFIIVTPGETVSPANVILDFELDADVLEIQGFDPSEATASGESIAIGGVEIATLAGVDAEAALGAATFA